MIRQYLEEHVVLDVECRDDFTCGMQIVAVDSGNKNDAPFRQKAWQASDEKDNE
jgi:hypothetical protein